MPRIASLVSSSIHGIEVQNEEGDEMGDEAEEGEEEIGDEKEGYEGEGAQEDGDDGGWRWRGQ